MNIFQMFFLTYKFYKSGLYIVPNFGHAQCSIWWFLILTFIKTASLTTNHYLLVLAIFPRLKMTQFLSVSYLCLMYKLTFYSHCIWKCSFWYFLENTEIFLYYCFFLSKNGRTDSRADFPILETGSKRDLLLRLLIVIELLLWN